MFEGIMQPMHLLVILVIALLFFGPGKLGELGKGLGDGIRHTSFQERDERRVGTGSADSAGDHGGKDERTEVKSCWEYDSSGRKASAEDIAGLLHCLVGPMISLDFRQRLC